MKLYWALPKYPDAWRVKAIGPFSDAADAAGRFGSSDSENDLAGTIVVEVEGKIVSD